MKSITGLLTFWADAVFTGFVETWCAALYGTRKAMDHVTLWISDSCQMSSFIAPVVTKLPSIFPNLRHGGKSAKSSNSFWLVQCEGACRQRSIRDYFVLISAISTRGSRRTLLADLSSWCSVRSSLAILSWCHMLLMEWFRIREK